MSGRKIIVLACGLGFLILLGFAGLGWSIWKVTEVPAGVARAQLDALNRNDIQAAYDLFSPATKQSLSLEEFRAFVQKHSRVLKTSDVTFSNRNLSNNVATLTGTLTSQAGDVVSVRYILVQQNGLWRVESFHLGAGAGE